MLTQHILFLIFAAITVCAAFGVITARNPVRAVLFLVLAFLASAVIWLLLQAEFLALALVVVYVGAVMVLFLFVIMMLNANREEQRADSFVRYWPLAAIIGLLMMIMLAWVVGPEHFGLAQIKEPAPAPADYSNIKVLGAALFTHYVYPFILAAVLLLAAMICAITLTHRGKRPSTKAQIPSRQIATRPQDRLRVVKMPSEERH